MANNLNIDSELALLDEDGENNAVRSFLMQYSCDRATTVGAMLAHMNRSGWRAAAPAFALEVRPEEHLTKAGAQLWIRHLLSMEASAGAPLASAPATEPDAWITATVARHLDMQYRNGFRDGWNAGVDGDEDKLAKAQSHVGLRSEYAAMFPADAAPLPPPGEAGELDTIHKFLLGVGPLDGYHFGQEHPDYIGPNWWRPHLRAAIAKESGELAKLREAVTAYLEDDGEEHVHPKYGRGVFFTYNCAQELYRQSAALPAEYAERYQFLRARTVQWNALSPSGWMTGEKLDNAVDTARALPHSMGKGK